MGWRWVGSKRKRKAGWIGVVREVEHAEQYVV